MFNTIINPNTNRKVQLHSVTGHKILNNYIKQVGGWGGFRDGAAVLASTASLAYGTQTLSGLKDASPEGMAAAKKMEAGMAANKFGYAHNNLIDINYGDGSSGSIDNAAAKKKLEEGLAGLSEWKQAGSIGSHNPNEWVSYGSTPSSPTSSWSDTHNY